MPLDLLRKIKAIRLRLQWIEFCRRFFLTVGWVCLALFIYVLASKLVTLPSPYTPELALPWVAGAGLLWIVAWTWFRRVRLFDAAVRADETLGLKERLSSALLIRQPRNEAEIAVLQDASQTAEGIRPLRHFPSNLKREFRWAAIPLTALVALWLLMPQFDLVAKRAEKKTELMEVKTQVKKEAAKELEGLAKQVAETTELKQTQLAKDVQIEMAALAKKIGEKQVDSEEAMAKLSKMSDKIAERQADLEKKLAKAGNMQNLGEGKMTREISKALEKGNFAKAADALEELKKKMESGQLSKEEKESLQKEMKAMAEKMGKDSPAGKALAKAAEKMAEGKMAEAMGEMENAMGEMKDMEAMLKEMKECDSLKYDMDARNKAMSGKPGICESCGKKAMAGKKLCKGCDGIGEWKAGENRQRSNGRSSGGPGIGNGGEVNKGEGDVGFDKTRVKGDVTKGKIISKMKIAGEQNIGEVTTAYEEMRMEYEQRAEDTISNEVLPLEKKTLVREYFDAIKAGKEPEAGKEAEADKQTDADHAHDGDNHDGHDHAAEQAPAKP